MSSHMCRVLGQMRQTGAVGYSGGQEEPETGVCTDNSKEER